MNICKYFYKFLVILLFFNKKIPPSLQIGMTNLYTLIANRYSPILLYSKMRQ